MSEQPRDRHQKLPIQSFTGGMNEFLGEVQPGQFLDGRNVETFHGELRTRGGQRLIAAPYPSVLYYSAGLAIDGRPAYLSTNPRGLTVGQAWYVAIDRIMRNGVTNRGCMKFLSGFMVTGTNSTTVTVQWEYLSTVTGLWTSLSAQEIGVGGGYLRVATRHLQYSPFLLLLNNGDDAFFEDWALFTEPTTGSVRYWLRARILAGTNAAGLNITLGTSPGAVPSCRPTMLVSATTRGAQRIFALGLPQPSIRPRESEQRLLWHMGIHQAAAPRDSALLTTLNVSLDRWSTPNYQGAFGTPSAAEDRVPYAGASIEASDFTAASPVVPTRVMLPNAPFVYVAETGRLVVATETGLGSLKPRERDVAEVQLIPYPNDPPLVWSDYPTFNADRMPALYGDARPILRHAHVGPVNALNLYDGRIFALIGNRLQWSLVVPYEDIWVPEAFTTIADVNGASGRGLLAYNGQNLCFMDDSIHVAEPLGDEKLGNAQVQSYITRRAVGGVGAMGHASIIDAGGVPLFVARDGIRAFDGSADPPLLTGAIQETWDRRISRAGLAFAVGCYHQTKRQAWFAMRRLGSTRNDLVIVIDLRHNGGVLLFEGIEAEQMVYDATEGVIYTADSKGFIFEQGFGHADGHAQDRAITAYVVTGPLPANEAIRVARHLVMRMRRFAGVRYRITPIVDGAALTGDRIREFGGDRLSTDALYPAQTSELEWGDAAFSWSSASPLPPHEIRGLGVNLDAFEGLDIRLRIEVANPAAGDLMSLLNLAVLAKPGGIL